MKIVSRFLYPYAKRALDLVKKEHGENKTIMLYGAEVSLGVDGDGNIVIFSLSRDSFNIDAVEKALRVFIGDLQDEGLITSPVIIVEKTDNVLQKDQ